MTQFLSSIAERIAERENHAQESDKENSIIHKSFLIGFLISCTGLVLYAYWQQSMVLINIFMAFLIFFKQILLNVIEACKPYRFYPKKFAKHSSKFKVHSEGVDLNKILLTIEYEPRVNQ